MIKQIVIMGGGRSKRQVPWDAPQTEFWGVIACLGGIRYPERVTRWFEIHQLSTIRPQDRRACRAVTAPVYMAKAYPAIPRAVRYPIERVSTPNHRQMFTCSFCYMLALAVWRYPTARISLYGIELASGTARERTVERMGLLYWIGRADRAGNPVYIPPEDYDLVMAPLYGLDYWAEVQATRRYLRGIAADVKRSRFDGFSTEWGITRRQHRIARRL